MEGICRTCMTSSAALVNIFADQRIPSLSDIINECGDCDIKADDELPNTICLSCICDAQTAFKFKRRCEESRKRLSEKSKKAKVESSYELLTVKLETSVDQSDLNVVKIKQEGYITSEQNYRNECSSKCKNSAASSGSTINPKQNDADAIVQSEVLTKESWELAEENIDLGCIKIEKEHSTENIQEIDKDCSENHQEICNSSSDEPSAKKSQLQCPHCPKRFSQSSHVNAHIRTHTGEKPYQCPHCPKAFSQASNLRKHISLHSGERPFKCPHCTKAFTRQTDLQYHISTHPGERIYKCPHCTRYFIKSDELDEHVRYHTGERSYKCEECSKEFTYAWQLQRHIRTHTGEQPFKCPQCPKTCVDKGDLGRHMLSHTGERPHKCPHCPKGFTRAAYLKTHINTHKIESK